MKEILIKNLQDEKAMLINKVSKLEVLKTYKFKITIWIGITVKEC